MNCAELRSIQQLKAPFTSLSKILLEGSEISLGRSLDNKINVPFVGISRFHSIFKECNNVWTIRDISSVGICINERKIPKDVDHVLKNLDIIKFDTCGEFTFCFLQRISKEINSINKEKPSSNGIEKFEHDLQGKKCDEKLNEQLLNEKNKKIEQKEKNEVELKLAVEKIKSLHTQINVEQEKKMEFMKNIENKLEGLNASLEKKNNKIKKLKEQIKNINNSKKLVDEKNEVTLETSPSKKRKLSENDSKSQRIKTESSQVTVKVYNELLDKEFICPVCHETFYKASILNCGHTFCEFCLNRWEKKSHDCPSCRKIITSRCENYTINSIIENMVSNLDEDTQNKRKELIKNREVKIVKTNQYNLRKRRGRN